MGLLERIRSLGSSGRGTISRVEERAVEGAPRSGPWNLLLSGGYLPADVGNAWNWWQMGYDPVPAGTSAMVEACVSAYSQTIAMCPGNHWFSTGDGGRERIVNSDLTRIIRRPNDYQSISDFMLNMTRSLYMRGNAFAVALRNDRREVDSLHICSARQTFAQVAEDGDLFYRCSGNEILSELLGASSVVVPSRDVLHIRLHTSEDDPLTGHSPIEAVAMEMMASGAMSQQQVRFYLNQARPGFVLSTDAPLTLEQANELRGMWEQQSTGLNAGKTPILTRGLKPVPLGGSSRDAQLAEVMKLTDERIALAFRVPLAVLGMGPTPFASTEALMSLWKASGLGFALNHIEEAMGNFFRLKGQPDEYLEFDTSALLRSSFKERIDALTSAVKGSVMSTNEARADIEFPKVQHGQYVRGQAQDVPLGPPVPQGTPVPGATGGLPVPPSEPVVGPAEAAAGDDDPVVDDGLAPDVIRAVAFSLASNALVRYDPNQPRAPDGKWGSGGSGGDADKKPSSTKKPRGASDLYRATAVDRTPEEVLSARSPETRAKVDAAVARLGTIVPTDSPISAGGHRNPDGTWTAERQDLHERIISDFFSPDRVSAATPASGEAPTLVMLGGRGGSGKGTLLRDGTVDVSRAMNFDPDNFKAALPEYEGWNASQVHEESNHLLARSVDIARRARLNTVVDATMSSDSAIKRLSEFKQAGYRTEGHYVYASPETAANRALDRFERGGDKGRYVPLDYILGSKENERRFDRMTSSFDEWHVYDNDAGATKPTRVASGGRR